MTNKDDNLNEEYAKIALITAIVYTELEKVREDQTSISTHINLKTFGLLPQD